MNIGLNAISFVPGKIGGMETYFRNLLTHLQRLDTTNRYTILCDRRHAGEFSRENSRFQVRFVNYARPSFNWFVRGVLRNSLHVDILGREMRGLGFDFIHHPFTVLTPLNTGIPALLTFWDMQHEFLPEFFGRMEIQRRRRTYQASSNEAERIIVSARFTRDCLVERYGVAAGKIEVIYTGFGPQYRILDDPTALESFRQKYGLRRPFLYYPAATWPHKNHKNLLAALKILVERHRFDGELLLTGIAMQSHGEILSEIHRLGLGGRVRVLGYLTSEELPYLYNLARLLVFPSLFEGFGIPLVEAMACGCPVVCSDATSLPEVAGDAGVLFDPHAPEEIAEKIREVWDDNAVRDEMRRRGLERARLFTWDETARRTLQVYGKMGEKPVTFSIITVTFNSCEHLEETVSSVLSQDFDDFEYILVDGGSADTTLDIIRRHAGMDDRIRWVSEPDEGIADAFNKGINMAHGDVIGILNSDDTYAPGALASVAAAFAAHPVCDVVHGDMLRFQGDTPLFRLKPSPVDGRIWHDMLLNHPATFVRRRAYDRIGLFDKRLRVAMDYELVLRLYRAGCRFHYLDRALANMRYGGASDEQFLAARQEVYAVTVAAGYPRWRAAGWFVVRLCMNIAKNLLRRLGLKRLILLHPKFRHFQNGD